MVSSDIGTSMARSHDVTGDDHVVIPPMFLPEVRKLPDDVLSFPKATATVSVEE